MSQAAPKSSRRAKVEPERDTIKAPPPPMAAEPRAVPDSEYLLSNALEYLADMRPYVDDLYALLCDVLIEATDTKPWTETLKAYERRARHAYVEAMHDRRLSERTLAELRRRAAEGG